MKSPSTNIVRVSPPVRDEPPTGAGFNWGAPNRGSYPVNGVSWINAQRFALWAGHRLPTEAEWEYVARSRGQDIRYPWGYAEPTCDLAHNYSCPGTHTIAICSLPDGDSAQGVCDLAGNVWEWVADQYHRSYAGAPADGRAWCDVADCSDLGSLASFVAVIIEQTLVECARRPAGTTERVSNLPGWASARKRLKIRLSVQSGQCLDRICARHRPVPAYAVVCSHRA